MMFFLLSCISVKNIQKGAVVLEDSYRYYFNDSISFSYKMPGDYDQITSKRKIRYSSQLSKHLPLNHCLTCFKTIIPPDFIHYTLYYSDRTHTTNNELLNAIKNDTTDFYINEDQCIVGKFISLENNKGSIFIIGYSNKNEFSYLKQEYADIFYHVITNEKYRNYAPYLSQLSNKKSTLKRKKATILHY